MSTIFPQARLFNTEARTLTSIIVGQEYQLSIALPESYAGSNQAYPVIYLLDGDLLFGMAAGLTPIAHWGFGTPEVIIVGIGYGMESLAQWGILRERDFKLPVIDGAPTDSVADRFLNALTNEIIPFIDTNYRTIPTDRCLYGYSSSGFFTLYALFHQPNAFQRYIAGSGDLYLAYPYLTQHDNALGTRDTTTSIDVYISAGELEANQYPAFQQFIAYFEQRHYQGLRLITEIYTGEYHSAEGIALTYLHGIRKVYPNIGPPSALAMG